MSDYALTRNYGYAILNEPDEATHGTKSMWRYQDSAEREACRRTLLDGHERIIAQVLVIRREDKDAPTQKDN